MKNRFLKTSFLALTGLSLSATGYSLDPILISSQLKGNHVIEISLPEGVTPHVHGTTIENNVDEELIIPNLLASTLTIKLQESTFEGIYLNELDEPFALQKIASNEGVFFILQLKTPALEAQNTVYKATLDSVAEGSDPLQILLAQESTLSFQTAEGATMQVIDESGVDAPRDITTDSKSFLMVEDDGDAESDIRIRFRVIEDEAEVTPEPTPVATPEASPEATPEATPTPDVDEDINTGSSGGCSLGSVANSGGMLPTALMLGMGLVSVLRRKKS